MAEVVREAGDAPLVLFGKDTRRSGAMLEAALMSGLMERGVDVLSLGVMPSAGVAYLTRHFGAGLGVVISASHNPHPDNGIKLFAHTGFKVADEVEGRIELLAQKTESVAMAMPARLGEKISPKGSPEQIYLEALVSRSGRPEPLQGWHLVLDCANGAAYRIGPEFFRQLGAKVTVLHAEPDGENINHNCGSEHPQSMRDEVLRQRADAGIALDGDADRLLVLDEQGNVLDGDHILYILARDLHERHRLRNQTVVGTVMSNLGLERALAALGIHLERVGVGDRRVVRRMLEGDFNLGGEPSGHIVLFGEGGTTGDGLYTAIKVLGACARRKLPLSALVGGLRKFPQVIINVPVSSKPPLESLPELGQVRRLIEERLAKQVRIVLRYSGTQPLARVMVEGEDAGRVQWTAQVLAKAIHHAISVRNTTETDPPSEG
jgi:phosphoglucosamine mutase